MYKNKCKDKLRAQESPPARRVERNKHTATDRVLAKQKHRTSTASGPVTDTDTNQI